MPTVQVEAIRRFVDPLKVLEHYDIRHEPSQEEDNVLFLCPFHDDHNLGSAYMRMTDGMWICFSCGQGGNIYQFAARLEGKSVSEVSRIIDSNFGLENAYTDEAFQDSIAHIEESAFLPKQYAEDVELMAQSVLLGLRNYGASVQVVNDWVAVCSWMANPDVEISESLRLYIVERVYSEFLITVGGVENAQVAQ